MEVVFASCTGAYLGGVVGFAMGAASFLRGSWQVASGATAGLASLTGAAARFIGKRGVALLALGLARAR
jgi:hypothetical protein